MARWERSVEKESFWREVMGRQEASGLGQVEIYMPFGATIRVQPDAAATRRVIPNIARGIADKSSLLRPPVFPNRLVLKYWQDLLLTAGSP